MSPTSVDNVASLQSEARLRLLLQESQEQRDVADAQRSDAWKRAGLLTEQLAQKNAEIKQLKTILETRELGFAEARGDAERLEAHSAKQHACLSGQLAASEGQRQLLQDALLVAQKKERESAGKAAAAESVLHNLTAERDEAIRYLSSSRTLLQDFQAQLACALQERDDFARQMAAANARAGAIDNRLLEAEALEVTIAQRQSEAEDIIRKAEVTEAALREKHRGLANLERRISTEKKRLDARETEVATQLVSAEQAKAVALSLQDEATSYKAEGEVLKAEAANQREKSNEILQSVRQESLILEKKKEELTEATRQLENEKLQCMRTLEEAKIAEAVMKDTQLKIESLTAKGQELEGTLKDLKGKLRITENQLSYLQRTKNQHLQVLESQLQQVVELVQPLAQQSIEMKRNAESAQNDRQVAEMHAKEALQAKQEAVERLQRIEEGRAKIENAARKAQQEQLALSAERRKLAAEKLDIVNRAQALRGVQLKLASQLRATATEHLPASVADIWEGDVGAGLAAEDVQSAVTEVQAELEGNNAIKIRSLQQTIVQSEEELSTLGIIDKKKSLFADQRPTSSKFARFLRVQRGSSSTETPDTPMSKEVGHNETRK